MKKTIFFIAILGITIHSIAQQIPLKGVVTVQNSKTYTGKIQYVKNAEVTHPHAKSDVTDNDGKFTLNITGLQQNIQTQIAVTLHGTYSDYVIVNEKELQNITLGRVIPIGVYICKKGELEQRQAEMVGINMQKLEERIELDKKRLQKELDALRQNNDYLNVRYSEIKDTLNIISKNIDKSFERIKEYAKSMALENLDDKENNYVKAYECFSRGELDSVSYYLPDHELELRHQKILQIQEEIKREKGLVEILTESIKTKEEHSENSLNELIKEWLLLARTYSVKNNYDKTMFYYEKTIEEDESNVDVLLEYSGYLYDIHEYIKGENYYLQCLQIYRNLATENPKEYLPSLANILNNLAHLHLKLNDYAKALEKYEEALKIRRNLAAENPKEYLPNVANVLNNLANLHRDVKEYAKALEEYEEALKIRRNLAAENPKVYLPNVAMTLNNLAILHRRLNEYSKASEEYEEALKIYRNLATENPKAYLPDVAMTLNNLAFLHETLGEYSKALEKYEEALQIHRPLAAENPKVYLHDMAKTLNNLANSHCYVHEYSKALEEHEEALKIRKNLAAENPKTYLSSVAETLYNLAELHLELKEYPKALEEFEEALKIWKNLVDKNPKTYLPYIVMTLNDLVISHRETQEYSKAIQALLSAYEVLESMDDKDTLLEEYNNLLDEWEKLEKLNVVPEEHKADIEKIREKLK